jgi:hypothetical protein
MTTKKSEILIRVQPELKEKAKEYADSKKWSLSTLSFWTTCLDAEGELNDKL